MPDPVVKLSRRAFIRLGAELGLAGVAGGLAGCTSPTATPRPTAPLPFLAVPEPTPPAVLASPVATLVPTSTAMPGPSPTAAEGSVSSPTPFSISNLVDINSLATVYVAHDASVSGYPAAPPFDPDQAYPEYAYAGDKPAGENGCYRLVREALRLFAPEDYDTPGWNPLGSLIRPGDRVLIKPNLVDDSAWKLGQITHPAFLRPIVDYAVRACGPTGQVILAEGPWAAGVFDRLVRNTGIQAMVDHLVKAHGAPVVLLDLDKSTREATPLVDLGTASALTLEDRVWQDAHYKPMQPGGDPGVGRYRIAPSVLEADVVISVPKIKVHCSGGATLTMKNMLGIIPAWDGPYGQAQLKDCAHASNHDMAKGNRGKYLENDTIWRSMADLNRILLYADGAGRLQPPSLQPGTGAARQRRYLTIVDGIIAAEESQYTPHPRPLGTVVIGTDPVTCDAVTARTMGFDPRRLRSVTQPELVAGYPLGPWRPAAVRVVTSWGGGLNDVYRAALTPELHVYSWQGHVEAGDFDPPDVLSVAWPAGTGPGELRVQLRDAVGTAYVRLAYTYEGRPYVQALDPSAGDARAGEWRAAIPPIATADLLVADELFNAAALPIKRNA